MYPLTEEVLEEFSLDVSPVGENLSEEFLCEYTPNTLVSIINVYACETERYDSPGIIVLPTKVIPVQFPKALRCMKSIIE